MNKKQALIQNLTDAGCDATLKERFIALVELGQEKEALILLAKHRKTLLEHCHVAEKQIDCLDYLVYQTKIKSKERQGGNS